MSTGIGRGSSGRRRRMSVPMTAAAGAALAAALLSACGPDGSDANGKPSASATASVSDPATTAAPATSEAAPTTPPTTTTAPTTTAPKPSQTPATKAPAQPAALMASGQTSAKVRELQARLGQLHFFSRNPTGFYGTVTEHAVSDFQERHGLSGSGTSVTETTWSKLTSLTHTPTHKELYPPAPAKPAQKLDARCMTGRALCISKTTRTLSWVVDGKVQATMDVRFGSQYTPTREGLFHVNSKSRDHVSTIYHTSMPFAMFFSGGQAVHYSSDFAARGYAGASHGCVNVRDKAAISKLFDEVKVGDKVVVYW
ncbi:L,D-transpeptidase family protein [Streptomyces sp. NPDC004031]